MSRPLRILVLSSLNNPEWASVPLVGYLHSAALAKVHDVTLVTSSINQEALERAPRLFKEMCFIRQPLLQGFHNWFTRVVLKGNTGSQLGLAVYVLVYLAFEWRCWRRMKPRLLQGEFDVVLRLTPVSPIVPSPIAVRLMRIGVPFVFGPINGGLPWPKGFSGAQLEKEWISPLRRFADQFPCLMQTRGSAAAIIAGSTTTWNELSSYAEKRFFVPENGVDAALVRPLEPRDPAQPLRLICVSRLVPYKSVAVAIKASAFLLKEGRASLKIFGGGPLRTDLELLAVELGIGHAVEFLGVVPHAAVIEHFREADVLLHPSVREFGGGVVVEALATGTVPIVANFGGPADLIEDDRGIKVPMENETQYIRDFSAAIDRLDQDRASLAKMREAGQSYVSASLTWDCKAAQTTQILEFVMGRAEAPELRPPGIA